MRVVIFSGTTEGRTLSAQLSQRGIETVVCVATEYGRVLQQQVPGTRTLTGRLTAAEMAGVLEGAALCIDATHPYARGASQNIRTAAKAAGVPCHRLLRQESPLPADAVAVDSAREAAAFLAARPGSILLTTGAKELGDFALLDPRRLYPRVLPMVESLTACEAAGIPRGNIIAMQGPFSCALNCALLRQFQISWLVTKDGGRAGGFEEKAEAARETGAGLVVIRRPQETGESYDRILQRCEEMMLCR